MLQPSTAPQRAGQLPGARHAPTGSHGVMLRATKHQPYPPPTRQINTDAPTDVQYDAVVVGGGMGGLTAAAKLAARGAKVVVLEKYLVPGGSAAHFKREGYTFDVGSSMMFGFGDKGTTNLITKALEAVGKKLETVPDPTQVHYHLPRSKAHPEGLSVQVWRNYNEFIAELTKRFPSEAGGIRKFYGECWRVFNALNSLEMKSLEEPRYLMGEFFKNPLACLTLASFVATNTGDVSRRHISDPDLLRFIDLECFIWSTVSADLTPMINAGMVFCDRHFGGINYPLGGVGRIGEEMAQGIEEKGGHVLYKANVKEIITEEGSSSTDSGSSSSGSSGRRATGVRLADGRVFRGRSIISNATRWDTFEGLLGGRSSSSGSSSSSNGSSGEASSSGSSSSTSSSRSSPSVPLPRDEQLFRQRYKKSPSFLSIHMGVRADVLPPDTDVHHIVLEDWSIMEQPRGTLFVSIPTLLDPSLAPEGRHIVHAFTPDWVEAYAGMGPAEYEAAKEAAADEVVRRLEALWPGLAAATEFREVGTPRTHRRYLNREDGTYGPIPSRRPLGMLSMPFNSTSIPGLYCVGDSTFPGQGVNAVVFSGFGVAHRVAVDLGMEPGWPIVDKAYAALLRTVRDRS